MGWLLLVGTVGWMTLGFFVGVGVGRAARDDYPSHQD